MKRFIHSERFFFFFLFFISLFATASVYLFHFNGPPIRSDGLGYYAYLPSSFIYNDISMNKFIEAYSEHYNDPSTDNWNGIYKYENTGKYLNKYPIGVAVMSLPFFLLAHIGTLTISVFTGIPPDGFTNSLYHIAQSISGTFYGIVGLFILKKILDKYFKPKVVYITLLLITFGTNLFHYITYDAVFSHAYSFFLFSLFILLTQKWHQRPSIKSSILIGITTGLITITRPTNLAIILFFVFYGLTFNNTRITVRKKVSLFFSNYKFILIIILVGSLVSLIQLLYWYTITSHLFIYSYSGEYFDFRNPQILNVLFSIRKGLFFWSPILLLSIPGFYFLNKKFRKFLLPTSIFLALNIYIISCWWSWSYGGSFGMRALVEIFPFLALPIAAVLEKILGIKSKKIRIFLLFIVLMLCLFSIFMMIQYWRGLIPIDGTKFEDIKNLF